MQRNIQRVGDGGSPTVTPACKWTAEGVIKTIRIVSISRRKAHVSCHGYAGIQESAQVKSSERDQLRSRKPREASRSEKRVDARARRKQARISNENRPELSKGRNEIQNFHDFSPVNQGGTATDEHSIVLDETYIVSSGTFLLP